MVWTGGMFFFILSKNFREYEYEIFLDDFLTIFWTTFLDDFFGRFFDDFLTIFWTIFLDEFWTSFGRFFG